MGGSEHLSNDSESFDVARNTLISRLRHAHPNSERLLRVEEKIPPIDLLRWLDAQKNVSRYYWRNRDGKIEMAGIGEALEIASEGAMDIHVTFEEIRRRLPDLSNARFYGGFRFHPNSRKGVRWNGFKACRFVIPRVELLRNDTSYSLSCTVAEYEDIPSVIHVLEQVVGGWQDLDPQLPDFSDRDDVPRYQLWQSMVYEALKAIKSTVMEKVVLARETTFTASAPIDPLALTRALSTASQNSYLFCFQPGSSRAFLGISPELLYRRSGTLFESEALAGTRPCGRTDQQKQWNADYLSKSVKDKHEHQIVVDEIAGKLSPFCVSLDVAPKPEIVALAHCLHLRTPIYAQLMETITDHTLIEALHPTPAVAGKPTQTAIQWILDHEPFERGIYTAPVGWMGQDSAEFCVGIRSALVRENSLALYAGAGIVQESDPAEEWAELESKIRPFLNVIRKDM